MLQLKLIWLLGAVMSIYGLYDFRHEYANWREQPYAMKMILINIAVGGVICIVMAIVLFFF